MRFSILLLLLLNSFVSFSQIVLNEVLAVADACVAHRWAATADNIKKTTCGGKLVESAPWVRLGENESIPYCWGGYSTISGFDSGMKNGKSAGDITTSSVALSCAEGLDCSGFVSRAWGLTTRYTTSSIPSITKQYASFTDLQPGDVMNKAGSHTMFVYEVNPNGSITVVEAAKGASNGGADGMWSVFYWTYSYSDLQTLVGKGYQPRYYSDFTVEPLECDECDKAEQLAVASEYEYKAYSVEGMTSSGMDIPVCGGWQSSGANDMWFSFVAVASSQTVSVDPLGDLDAVVALYASCDDSDLITCVDVNGGGGLLTDLTYDGFSAGETYMVRVFDYGTVMPADGRFRVAVKANNHAPVCTDVFEPNDLQTAPAVLALKDSTVVNLCISKNDIDYFIFNNLEDDASYSVTLKLFQNGSIADAVINKANAEQMLEFKGADSPVFSVSGPEGEYALHIFVEKNNTVHYSLALDVYPPDAGRVSGAGIYMEQDTATVAALASEGYAFKEWQVEGQYYSRYAEGWLVMNKDISLIAVFEEQPEVGIVGEDSKSVFELYPNPVNDKLFVDCVFLAEKNYKVLSLQGQVLAKGNVAAGKTVLDVGSLPRGVYVLEISGVTQKFVKR